MTLQADFYRVRIRFIKLYADPRVFDKPPTFVKEYLQSKGLARERTDLIYETTEDAMPVDAAMIALGMVMLNVFAQGEPQGALAEEDHFGQALLLDRPHPAFRVGIQVRTARRQRERFNPT